ncbi:MAG: hypothetical protein K8L91_20885, partial [Anaerolineae bacterium]|nr:hypothetical protein [Anaerolineae bacterium]
VLEQDEYAYLPFFDGLPLFMKAIPNAADAYTLWELFPDGTTRKVYEPVSALMGLQAISSDGEWAAFYGHYETRNTVLLLKLDWTRAYQLHDAYVLDWLPPIDRAWSPVGLLVIGSVLMLGGVIRRRGKRKS